MARDKAPPYRWRFIRHHEGGARNWIWQRFGPDGRLEKTSDPHAKYGTAMLDAIRHGFRPKEHLSSIDLKLGSMHFPPGRCPVYQEITELREETVRGSRRPDTQDATNATKQQE